MIVYITMEMFTSHKILQTVKSLPTTQGMQEMWVDPWVRKMAWRKEWQPTPVFLPEESHGQRSLVGYSPLCHIESDMAERLKHTIPKDLSLLLSLKKYLFIYWVAPGLSCGVQNLQLRHAGSSSLTRDEPGPLHWELSLCLWTTREVPRHFSFDGQCYHFLESTFKFINYFIVTKDK